MRVEVKRNNVEKALRILKKKMFDDGSIKLLMERRFYEKPSRRRRRKKLEAINRQKKIHERENATQNSRRHGLRLKK